MTANFSLRPAQVELQDMLENAMIDSKRILVVASTGSGKTVSASHFIADQLRGLYPEIASGLVTTRWGNPEPKVYGAPKQILFVVHRNCLVKQTIKKLKGVFASRVIHNGKRTERGMGDAITVIKSGVNYDRRCPIVVVSQQSLSPDTLKSMLKLGEINPWMVVFDECHTTATCPTGKAMIEILTDLRYNINFTATPFWTDKEMVASLFFDATVVGRSMQELIASGELTQPHYMGIDYPVKSTETYKDAFGKMRTREIRCRYESREEISYSIAKFKEVENGDGRNAIAFANSVEHAELIKEMFSAAGILAEIISYKTKESERERIFAGFEGGPIQLLISVDALGVGYDEESIVYVILYNLTESVSRHWQRIGRGTRVYPGKDRFYVLDFAGAVEHHDAKSGMGMPDMVILTPDTIMGLKPRKKQEGVAPSKTCSHCDTINHVSARVCKNEACGEVFPIKEIAERLQSIPGDMFRIFHPAMVLDDLEKIEYFRSLRAKAWVRMRNPNTTIVDYNESSLSEDLKAPPLKNFVALRDFTMGAITGKPKSVTAGMDFLRELLKRKATHPIRWSTEVIFALVYLEFDEKVSNVVNDVLLNKKIDTAESILLFVKE